ncbi:MAG: hypothetical protein JKY03_13220 [Aureispira sp.]|nr:hypothetical protein [Aureispira sp.]
MNKVFRKISVVIGFIILFGGLYFALQLGESGAAKTKKPIQKLLVFPLLKQTTFIL